MNKKLKEVAQSAAGEILRDYIKDWKSDVRDVSQDLPVECENEIAVRKNMAKIIEKDLEQHLTIKNKEKPQEPTSYE